VQEVADILNKGIGEKERFDFLLKLEKRLSGNVPVSNLTRSLTQAHSRTPLTNHFSISVTSHNHIECWSMKESWQSCAGRYPRRDTSSCSTTCCSMENLLSSTSQRGMMTRKRRSRSRWASTSSLARARWNPSPIPIQPKMPSKYWAKKNPLWRGQVSYIFSMLFYVALRYFMLFLASLWLFIEFLPIRYTWRKRILGSKASGGLEKSWCDSSCGREKDRW